MTPPTPTRQHRATQPRRATLLAWAGLIAGTTVTGLLLLSAGLRLYGHQQCFGPTDVCRSDVTSGGRLNHPVQILLMGVVAVATLTTFAAVVTQLNRGGGVPSTPPLPVRRLAQRAELGGFQGVYTRRSVGAVRPITGLMALALGLLLIGAVTRNAAVALIGGVLIAASPIVATGYLLSVTARALGRCAGPIYHYDAGLVLAHDGHRRAIAWTMIDEVQARPKLSPAGTVHHLYVLRGRGFSRLRLADTHYPQLAHLAGHLLPAIARAQLSTALDRLIHGEQLTFGPVVSADLSGVFVNGYRAPWSIITHLQQIGETQIAFPVPGTAAVHVPVADITNLDLLRMLSHHFTELPRRRPDVVARSDELR